MANQYEPQSTSKSSTKTFGNTSTFTSGAAGKSSEIRSKFSNFFKDGIAKDVSVYARNGIGWIKGNPKTSTTLALLGALAIGAIVRRSLTAAPALKIKKRKTA